MNSDANIAVHLFNRPNVNSQRKRVGFVEFLLPIYGGSLLKCQLCQRCGKMLSTCNDKLHISCMLHVFELLCLNNKKKLQCTSNKRSYSIVNTNLEWIIYCLLLRTKNGQSERGIYQFLSKALIFVATRHKTHYITSGSNRKSSWSKVIIRCKRCACRCAIWI